MKGKTMVLSSGVVLLDSNYQFISVLSWQRAVKLVVKEKVEVVKQSEKMIRDFIIPSVVRLLKPFAGLYNRQLKYSKENLFWRDEFVCQYCGNTLSKASSTIDHVVPTSKGGKTSWANCVLACKPCNSRKGAKSLHEAGLTLRKQPTIPKVIDLWNHKLKHLGLDLDLLFKSL